MTEAVVLDAPRHLSASSLNDLLVCERRWAYSHGIDPTVEKAPPNKWLVLGTALHYCIRAFYENRNPQEGYGLALQEAEAESGDITLAVQHAQGLFRQFELWQSRTQWLPTAQEGEHVFDFAGTPFVAFLDAENDLEIVDWKSARKAWDRKKQADAWLQATTYVVAKMVLTGKRFRRVKFVIFFYEDGKYRQQYGYQEYVHEVTDADIARFEALATAYSPIVQSTDISTYPIRPTSSNWLCSAQWCPFWTVCPGGNR